MVGFLFLMVGSMDINDENNQSRANFLNDVISGSIFLIMIINLIVSGFGIRANNLSVTDGIMAAYIRKES